jgi:hypothetical protein
MAAKEDQEILPEKQGKGSLSPACLKWMNDVLNEKSIVYVGLEIAMSPPPP